MSIPEITHVQALLLLEIANADRPGRGLRERLAQSGQPMSGPAFYQMMGRLEAAGLVAGHYRSRAINGHTRRERWYSITPAGNAAWRAVCDFYLGLLAEFDLLPRGRKKR